MQMRCDACGLSILTAPTCNCPQPVLVVLDAFLVACRRLGVHQLQSSSLHMAVLTEELLARGCEIAEVRRP